jgi:uncharacterized membrane-anchored protein YhcB (DUF1043 family)
MTELLQTPLASLLGGGALGSLIVWFLKRDRGQVDKDQDANRREIEKLWGELDRVKREHAELAKEMASLPAREELQRMEERLQRQIEILSERILSALAEARK